MNLRNNLSYHKLPQAFKLTASLELKFFPVSHAGNNQNVSKLIELFLRSFFIDIVVLQFNQQMLARLLFNSILLGWLQRCHSFLSKLPCKAWQLSPNVDCSAEDASQGGSTIVVLVKPELSYTRYHI